MPTVMYRKFEKACSIIEKYEAQPSKLIPILQEVQDEYRYLPEEVMTFVAMSLNLSPAKVFGVASFYAHFSLLPKGKHVIRLCDGTACHVKQSQRILDSLRKVIGVDEKNPTTSNMLFTVETVSCLGACGLAPVVVVDESVHGQMTSAKSEKLVQGIKQKEEQEHVSA